mmetsp:Transcript_17454/g.19878  ORF Transcript_17454/g.19878 Transcript_17454/m.19878 type:complete len:218 (+) Transcript_17454:43-696(+)
MYRSPGDATSTFSRRGVGSTTPQTGLTSSTVSATTASTYHVPEVRQKMDQAFASIGGVRSFTGFGRLTAEQQQCVEALKECKDKMLSTKGRERYLSDLIRCITGSSDEEEDEALNEATFSQYRFYLLYIRELLYYPEKFDFLLRCVEENVVVVQQPKAFLGLLEQILSSQRIERLPDEVVNYEALVLEDEMARIESFTLRKDWRSNIPNYLDSTRVE